MLATQLSIALHNSWCDRAADAVAKPWRLVPRGALDPAFVLFAALGLLLLGLTLAWSQSPGVLLLVAAGTAAGFVYNAWLKGTSWSWLPFALALPTLAVCSLLVAGRLDGIPYDLYLIGVPLVLAIHLADAVGDIEGDRLAGSHGLAVRLGERRSFLACWAGLLLAAIVAASLRPLSTGPGPAFALSLILLCIAVASLAWMPRAHRSLIFASAVALAVDHVGAVSV